MKRLSRSFEVNGFAGNEGLGASFLAFGIPVFSDLCDAVVGHQRWWGAMAKPRDDRQKDLLRAALEDVIDLGNPLVIAKYQRRFPGFDDKIVSMLLNQMLATASHLARLPSQPVAAQPAACGRQVCQGFRQSMPSSM